MITHLPASWTVSLCWQSLSDYVYVVACVSDLHYIRVWFARRHRCCCFGHTVEVIIYCYLLFVVIQRTKLPAITSSDGMVSTGWRVYACRIDAISVPTPAVWWCSCGRGFWLFCLFTFNFHLTKMCMFRFNAIIAIRCTSYVYRQQIAKRFFLFLSRVISTNKLFEIKTIYACSLTALHNSSLLSNIINTPPPTQLTITNCRSFSVYTVRRGSITYRCLCFNSGSKWRTKCVNNCSVRLSCLLFILFSLFYYRADEGEVILAAW